MLHTLHGKHYVMVRNCLGSALQFNLKGGPISPSGSSALWSSSSAHYRPTECTGLFLAYKGHKGHRDDEDDVMGWSDRRFNLVFSRRPRARLCNYCVHSSCSTFQFRDAGSDVLPSRSGPAAAMLLWTRAVLSGSFAAREALRALSSSAATTHLVYGHRGPCMRKYTVMAVMPNFD